jgi:8-oxo-dGTP pyrophosphatase MutT (NUDIX family)
MDKLDVCKDNLLSYERSGFDREFIRYNDYQLSVTPKAAVLIPLFIKNGEIHVLLTRRSHNVGSHKGQTSFAGGKEDKQDSSIVETALREANEEMGLDRKYVEIISTWRPTWVGGGRDPYFSLVYAVIGILKPGFQVHADSSEVAEVFDVPLECFLASESHEHGEVVYKGVQVAYHKFRYNAPSDTFHQSKQEKSYIIFGFTGSLCLRTAVIVYGRHPSFELVDKYEQKGLGGYLQFINGTSSCENVKSKL